MSSGFLTGLDRNLKSNDSQIRSSALLSTVNYLKKCNNQLVKHQAFLKLCDFLVYCSNHERLVILKIFQIVNPYSRTKVDQNRQNNNMEMNCPSEEMMKRILIVLNTNDSVSRSICLGICSCLRDFLTKEIHHRIIHILQNVKSGYEMNSVLKTAEDVCEIDPEFTRDIIPRVRDRIKSIDTPSSVKLMYIRLLRFVHDSELAYRRFEFIKKLMIVYPSFDFTRSLLKCILYLGIKHTIKMAKPTCHLFFQIVEKKNQDPRVKWITLRLIRKLIQKISEVHIIENLIKNKFTVSKYYISSTPSESRKLNMTEKRINLECHKILGLYLSSNILQKYIPQEIKFLDQKEMILTFLRSRINELVDEEYEEHVLTKTCFPLLFSLPQNEEIEELFVFRICELMEQNKKKRKKKESDDQFPMNLKKKYIEMASRRKRRSRKKKEKMIDEDDVEEEEEYGGTEISSRRREYIKLMNACSDQTR